MKKCRPAGAAWPSARWVWRAEAGELRHLEKTVSPTAFSQCVEVRRLTGDRRSLSRLAEAFEFAESADALKVMVHPD